MGSAEMLRVLESTRIEGMPPSLQPVISYPGGEMPCNKCASTHQQEFQGELTVAFPGAERLNLSPIYVCQKTFVCLDCGYTELVVPAAELEKLRKGMEGFQSKGA